MARPPSDAGFMNALKSPTLSLPLVAPQPEAAPAWHDWSAAEPLAHPDAPEPRLPQGEYGDGSAGTELNVPLSTQESSSHPVELLAPAGGPDAAFAAFHYGAH